VIWSTRLQCTDKPV